MSTVIYVLATIGAVVVGWVAYAAIAELVRAVRQGVRLAHVHARASGKRRPPSKWFVKFAVREYGSSYDEKIVHMWRLPHDPSRPVRRAIYP